MRTLARLCAIAFVLAALPLQARTRVALVEPRDGAVLRGGTTATVDWSAVDLPRDAEEWEAFLSVDGGRYYAWRITPHLDIERRRFTFDVPNIATKNARILIRVGDERDEHELALPASFSIVSDPARAVVEPSRVVVESERGESARAGEPGVIGWVEGNRDGEHRALRSAEHRGDTLAGLASIISASSSDAAVAPHSVNAPLPPAGTFAPQVIPRLPSHSNARPRDGRDILLVTRRLNI